ncbi:cytochrome P450 [Aspergillus aculeatinus CBS 121060]|uniref:Cytochrome P450 n=1 Tax=Aspergillus aculeatinus CBS 121060 TaxID=1448322 RepID=A0ACD1H0K1_9EURO|nr:cytochrome P450 [Aspergillus aculeatinus CBS 121060]RAH67125.1 cytochrome P450 [Aspergillus aculeatinus CBS 121060]
MLLVAGTETTANALTHIAFHLLDNRELLGRLREELKGAMPRLEDTLAWSQLEKLPFLNGVVQEGLRLTLGTASRLPRIAPQENLHFEDWVIPAGVGVILISLTYPGEHRHVLHAAMVAYSATETS